MTSDEIKSRIEAIEDEIMRLESQIVDAESAITKHDDKISSAERSLARARTQSSQKFYNNRIASENRKRLQKCKQRDSIKKQLNTKKSELLEVQRLKPDNDNMNSTMVMNTISPEDKIYQIFVSSTFEDLKLERQEIMAAIVSTGNVPIGMEYFPAGNASPFDYIKQQIDKADYYLLVIAGKYGSINKETGISYTEMEFNYAVEKGVPIAVLQYKNINQLSGEKLEMDDPKKLKLLKAFRSSSKEGRMADFWETPIELRMKVIAAVQNLIKNSPRTGWIKADAIPIQQQVVEPDFDFNSTVELHYHFEPNPFSIDENNSEERDKTKVVTWKQIIKELGIVITAPVSMYYINNVLCDLCGGIDEPSARKVLDTLVNLGILEVGTINTEETGVESYCAWTSRGFKLKASFSIEN